MALFHSGRGRIRVWILSCAGHGLDGCMSCERVRFIFTALATGKQPRCMQMQVGTSEYGAFVAVQVPGRGKPSAFLLGSKFIEAREA